MIVMSLLKFVPAYFFIKIVNEISLVAPVDILAASTWTFSNSSFS